MIRRRGKRTALRIVLTILAALILAGAALLFWKRDTVRLILKPSEIRLHGEPVVREAVQQGPYEILDTPPSEEDTRADEPPGALRYQTGDGAFTFTVEFEEQRIRRFQCAPDIHKIGSMGIAEGFALAETLLSPYLDTQEIQALELLLLTDIFSLTSRSALDYTRTIGDFTFLVTGALDRNDLLFVLES